MNPFEVPDQSFSLEKFLQGNLNKIEYLFKDFFLKQVNEEIDNCNCLTELKTYLINSHSSNNTVEIIYAYTNSQAAYLFLLYETKNPESFPFVERLKECKDLGQLTPYDIYVLTIHNIFDKDIKNNNYLSEIEKVIILNP